MRLIDYFPKSSISVIHSAKDWQEAIDFSMVSLLDKNYISENYIQAIKDSTINNGPYYILAPGVAMPHARPECGALKTGMSLTLLEQGVISGLVIQCKAVRRGVERTRNIKMIVQYF